MPNAGIPGQTVAESVSVAAAVCWQAEEKQAGEQLA